MLLLKALRRFGSLKNLFSKLWRQRLISLCLLSLWITVLSNWSFGLIFVLILNLLLLLMVVLIHLFIVTIRHIHLALFCDLFSYHSFILRLLFIISSKLWWTENISKLIRLLLSFLPEVLTSFNEVFILLYLVFKFMPISVIWVIVWSKGMLWLWVHFLRFNIIASILEGQLSKLALCTTLINRSWFVHHEHVTVWIVNIRKEVWTIRF